MNTFQTSAEFHLYSSEFGNAILENFNIIGMLYESPKSSIFNVIRIADNHPFTLKAIRKQADITIDVTNLSDLSHPGIAPIITYADTDHFIFTLKPYITGVTLHEMLKANGPFPEKSLRSIAMQLTEILTYLHERATPLIYRDLKPANIIINDDGQITLIDIETIRTINKTRQSDTFYVGTHGFASPEQFGFQQSDPRSDIYSLGATLYCLATGTPPPQLELTSKHITHINPAISTPFASLILKCMRFNPSDRYPTAQAVSTAIQRAHPRHYHARKAATLAAALFLITGLITYANTYLDRTLPALHPPVVESAKPSTASPHRSQDSTPSYIASGVALPPLSPVLTTVTEPSEAAETTEASEVTEVTEVTINEEIIKTPESIAVNHSEPLLEPKLADTQVPTADPLSSVSIPIASDQTEIIEIQNGIYITPRSALMHYSITVDRNLLPSNIKDFVYLSVLSVDKPLNFNDILDHLNNASRNKKGMLYNNAGFNSMLLGPYYLIKMFDKDFNPIAFQFFDMSDAYYAIDQSQYIPDVIQNGIRVKATPAFPNYLVTVDHNALPEVAKNFTRLSITSIDQEPTPQLISYIISNDARLSIPVKYNQNGIYSSSNGIAYLIILYDDNGNCLWTEHFQIKVI